MLRRDRITSAMERLSRCRDVAAQTPILDAQGRMRRDLDLVRRAAETRLAEEMRALDKRLGDFDHEVTEPVRERLAVAAQRERAVLTLVDRRSRAGLQEVERRERQALEEFGQTRWYRARGARSR